MPCKESDVTLQERQTNTHRDVQMDGHTGRQVHRHSVYDRHSYRNIGRYINKTTLM